MHPSLDSVPSLASAAPFVLLLLAIAFLPLVAAHWWEKNASKALVSGALGIPTAIWLVATGGESGAQALSHAMVDYVSFLSLLGALFVISGGVRFEGSFSGRPFGNVLFLGFGALLANLIGTTGASMVLVRPLLEANRKRIRKTHVFVFFVFVVSNCGGLLTPLGDPPLFLGFLKGVPFGWTLRFWPAWLLVNGLLLAVFFAIDQFVLAREDAVRPVDLAEEVREHRPLSVRGAHNALFLAGVVATTLGRGLGWGTDGAVWPFGLQEGLLFALAAASYYTTSPALRRANGFNFTPIVEVAVLFAGIFTTMVSPLLILNARGSELGLEDPSHYFWATGLLSSFLDNAPTYLAFATAAAGDYGVSVEGPFYLAELLAKGHEAELILAAISCGAVMMGANTYIGNGPNLMVKAIVEANGVRMPSFLGYMAWSLVVLMPIFALVTLVFLV